MSEPAPIQANSTAPASTPASQEPLIQKEPPPEPAPLKDAPPPKAEEPKYEFKAPDGYDTKEIEAFAKEHKIAPEVAQKILEREVGAVDKYVEANKAALEKLQKEEWVKEIYNDPVLGGKNIDKTRTNVMNVWQNIPKGVREMWTSIGMENAPPLIHLLNHIGQGSKEVPFKQANGAPTQQRKSMEAIFAELNKTA